MIKVLNLEDKQPGEILSYVIDMSEAVPSAETFDSVTFAIYDDVDPPTQFTDLAATMILTVAMSNSTRKIEAQVTLGDDAHTYVLRGRLLCTSGNKYEVEGKIRVREIG